MASGNLELSQNSDDINLSQVSHQTKRSYDATVFDILKVMPEDFASQITLTYLSVFKKIKCEEFLSYSWNNKDKLEKAPNIVAFTQCFNHVNFWVQGEILKTENVRVRSEILGHFIKIGRKLYDKQNLHGVMAVISALQSAAIYRLSNTWTPIPQKERKTFEKLAELVSEENNRKNLRAFLDNVKGDCIPYLGLYLSDLIYIDVAHPHSGGLDTEPRKSSVNKILRTINEFQYSQYSSLQPIEYLQSYLKDVRYIEELQKFVEDENFKKSLFLEPQVENETQGASSTSTGILNSRNSADDLINNFTITTIVKDKDYNNMSAKLSVYTQGQRHLLDDSELTPSCSSTKSEDIDFGNSSETELYENGYRITSCFPRRHSQKNSKNNSLNYSSDCNDNENSICQDFVMEGIVKLKIVLKDSRRPFVVSWQTVWMALSGSSLFCYSHKSLRQTRNRKNFKKNAYNMISIGGWSVMNLEENIFQIYNDRFGHLIKFKLENSNESKRWMEAIKLACSTYKEETDLIDLQQC